MQQSIIIPPIAHVNGIINLPGSKSISNRALLLSAQAIGTTILNNLLDCDDVNYMLTALKSLGINYRLSFDKQTCEIDGIGGPLYTNSPKTLFLGNAGTAMRPLTAALSLNKQDIILTGEQRMKERPIEHLVDALCQGGAKINFIGEKNYPPLHLHGGYNGGNIILDGSISSQFLSALLMMAPLASLDTCISIKGELVSKPYVNITLSLMKAFGINITNDNYQFFYIKGKNKYKSPGHYFIEGDASSASYFLAAGAIRGGTVKVTGVGKNSIQGDIYFADVLEKMGAKINWGNNFIECTKNELRAINMDMNHIPDAAMTIATTALFANANNISNTSKLCNIYNWRLKETDRLTAMATELRKVGAIVHEGNDSLMITPPVQLNSAKINTYNDHRMAMSFTLVALSNIPIVIMNPQCTKKTFPNFFKLFLNICSKQN